MILFRTVRKLTVPGQLRKMGILTPEKGKESPVVPRRKSTGLDLSALKPLNATTGTKNFAGYRDSSQKDAKRKQSQDAMDSDADDDDDDVQIKDEDADDEKDIGRKGLLSPEDARRQGELEEGVRKIKVGGFFLL